MVLTLGIALAVVALISTSVLRGTVGFLARGADNGWDNALAYVALSGVAWALVARYLVPLGVFPALLSAAVLPLVQLGMLRWIYEIRTGRALAVGIVHTVVASTAITGITLMVGVAAAYVMYGRIVQDPMLLVRLVLRLIGLIPE
jgi:hypothetical protein